MNEKIQNDLLAHMQANADGLPAGTVIGPPATCQVCGTDSCNAVNHHFGVCPICHKTDGYLNVGNDHWFLCHTHKTKWTVGANLFSSCMDETPEQQRAEQEKIGFASYEKVKPHHDTTGADEECDGCHCFRCEDNDIKSVSFGESFKHESRVSGLRTRLHTTGYKSIWQTETINHAGDCTVISSWVPNEVPGHGETPEAYKASIYEDIILVERYEGVDGMYPTEYCGSSIYIHGVEPIVNPRLFRKWEQAQGEDDAREEWLKAADAAEQL